ncbi:unnamed protein product [Dibothriocephalus latus]|uniref:Uncharacterized protein n=1 Tax=Dibothriocephalus latus TaxID=60516 RepID=A0A3P7MRS5_DIBLA|nr:unnamed protein product [Dibothriocephalus latus]
MTRALGSSERLGWKFSVFWFVCATTGPDNENAKEELEEDFVDKDEDDEDDDDEDEDDEDDEDEDDEEVESDPRSTCSESTDVDVLAESNEFLLSAADRLLKNKPCRPAIHRGKYTVKTSFEAPCASSTHSKMSKMSAAITRFLTTKLGSCSLLKIYAGDVEQIKDKQRNGSSCVKRSTILIVVSSFS